MLTRRAGKEAALLLASLEKGLRPGVGGTWLVLRQWDWSLWETRHHLVALESTPHVRRGCGPDTPLAGVNVRELRALIKWRLSDWREKLSLPVCCF